MNRLRSSLITLLTVGGLVAPITGSANEEKGMLMRVGYPGRLSTDVSREDAQVAVELWARQVTQKMGKRVIPRINFFDNREMLRAAIESESLDLVVLPVLDFLELREQVGIEPSIVSVLNGNWGFEMALLVKRDRNIERLEQLRGGRLMLQTRAAASSLEEIWLETLLRREGLEESGLFFREVKQPEKTSPAVLAVLFGQADAALVRRLAFDTMAELNPQLSQELTAIATSPGYVPTITYFLSSTEPDKRRAILEGALELHTYPRGRQILTLFANDRVIAFTSEHIASVESLVREYRQLVAAADDGSN